MEKLDNKSKNKLQYYYNTNTDIKNIIDLCSSLNINIYSKHKLKNSNQILTECHKTKKKFIEKECVNIKKNLIYDINNFNHNIFDKKTINNIKKINEIIDKVSNNADITNYISKNQSFIETYEN